MYTGKKTIGQVKNYIFLFFLFTKFLIDDRLQLIAYILFIIMHLGRVPFRIAILTLNILGYEKYF